jgi:beta-ureidopropionase
MTRLSVAQADFKVADPAANYQLIHSLLAEADEAGAEIVVLPELSNSGYALQDTAEARACAETIPGGPVCQLLAEWSRPGRMAVCGLCELSGEQVYNTAAVFTGGTCSATYRKAHLFMKETLIFTPGEEEPPVIDFLGYKIGLMICYDWAFPEVARLLALQGAQLLLHPSNLVLPYGPQGMLVRSIENRVFTATANRFGMERGLKFFGRSQITSPQGDLLAQAGPDFTGVITADLDLSQADDKQLTPYNHIFNDRRPALYQRLTQPKTIPQAPSS